MNRCALNPSLPNLSSYERLSHLASRREPSSVVSYSSSVLADLAFPDGANRSPVMQSAGEAAVRKAVEGKRQAGIVLSEAGIAHVRKAVAAAERKAEVTFQLRPVLTMALTTFLQGLPELV